MESVKNHPENNRIGRSWPILVDSFPIPVRIGCISFWFRSIPTQFILITTNSAASSQFCGVKIWLIDSDFALFLGFYRSLNETPQSSGIKSYFVFSPSQCFKYQISAIYWSAKLCTGYRVIYRDMVLNTGWYINSKNI